MRDKIVQVCGTADPLALILQGGDVRRYHTEALKPQDVAAHTWRVLVILLHFWPDSSLQLIKAALYHDVAERFTGDVPAPAKEVSPVIRLALQKTEQAFHEFIQAPYDGDLHPQDYERLKCSDYIELCITCHSQTLPCSYAARQVYARGVALVRKHVVLLPADEQQRVLSFIDKLSSGEFYA